MKPASTVIPKNYMYTTKKFVRERASFKPVSFYARFFKIRNPAAPAEHIKHFINIISSDVSSLAELEGNHMWKSSQNPALKVLLLVCYTAWGSCTGSAVPIEVLAFR